MGTMYLKCDFYFLVACCTLSIINFRRMLMHVLIFRVVLFVTNKLLPNYSRFSFLLACILQIPLIAVFSTASRKSTTKNNKRMSLYSIEFSPQIDSRLGDSDSQDYDQERVPPPVSPKPMTPRRVKRRSVMQRGTTSRHSTR